MSLCDDGAVGVSVVEGLVAVDPLGSAPCNMIPFRSIPLQIYICPMEELYF